MKRTLARIAAFIALGFALALPGHEVLGQTANGVPINAVAAWNKTLTRHIVLDYDGGNDKNRCYIDAAAGSSLSVAGIACKTWEHVSALIPKLGNGRSISVLIKPRSSGSTYRNVANSADDDLVIDWVGYADWEVRATADFSQNTADLRRLGGVTSAAGPGGGGVWTVNTATNDSIDTTSATLPTGVPGILGQRVRFVTGALADISNGVIDNTAGQILTMERYGSAPSGGDTFLIEKPGVAFGSVTVSKVSMDVSSLRRPRIVGIRSTGAAGWRIAGIPGAVDVAFCAAEAGNFTVVGVGDLKGTRSWTTSAGTLIDNVGPSVVLSAGNFDFTRIGLVITRDMAALGTSSSLLSLVNVGTVFRHSIARAGISADSNGTVNLGGGSSASGRRLRIFSVGSVGNNGARITSSNGTLQYADITNQTSGAFLAAGFGTTINVNDVTGSTGNTSAGIRLDFLFAAHILLGDATANTVTGTTGDILLRGGAVAAHTDLTLTSFMDQTGSLIEGNSGSFAVPAVLVTNSSGGAIGAGSVVKSNGTSSQVTCAKADTSDASSFVTGVMVTSPASGALGYMVTTGTPYVLYDGAPTVGAAVYLSPGTACRATTTVPAASGSNRRLRIGRNISASGSTGITAWGPEQYPTPGVAPGTP